MRAAVLLASLAPLAALALPVTSPADVLWQRASSSVTSDGSAVAGKAYDFVILGCGLGGMVAAARLSEDGASVLCVEAGDDIRNDPDVTNVARYSDVVGSSKNWKYQTVAQPQANGRQLQVSAGRGLGGSTSINGAAYTRASAGQLDALQELGNDGWNWASVLEAMKKSEHFHAPDASQASAGAAWNSSVHGIDGPLDISFPDTMYRGEPPKKFVAAVTSALGVELVNDLGNGEQPAVAWTPNTIKPYSGDAQTRVSSATAYLSPIEYDRENLVVLTGHRAAAIVWASDSGDLKRAESVTLLQSADAEPISVTVSKEVVLAAGAIRTPLLLEASGVGKSEVLSKIGVTQQIDLPGVGANLNEQTMNSIGGSSAGDADGSGPSATIAFVGISSLFSNASDVRSSVESQLDGWAQQAVDAGAHSSKAGLLKQYRKQVEGIWDEGWGVYELFSDIGFPAPYGIDTWGLLPFSRGTVHSTSASPFADPELDPRYFSVPFDMDVQVAGLRAARRVLQAMGVDEQIPGFDTIPDGSNHGRYSRWADLVRDGFASVAHPLGTAAMMPREDGGVVDAQLKVYSTANVRVVDASVLPMQQSTHLSSVLYGIAERGAELIKAAN